MWHRPIRCSHPTFTSDKFGFLSFECAVWGHLKAKTVRRNRQAFRHPKFSSHVIVDPLEYQCTFTTGLAKYHRSLDCPKDKRCISLRYVELGPKFPV